MKYQNDPLDPLVVPIWEAYSNGLFYKVNCEVSLKPGSPCSICNLVERQGTITSVRNHFHGSDLGACKRKVYWTMTSGQKFSPSVGQAFLNDGHMHEALVLSTINIGFLGKAHIEKFSNDEECIIEFGTDLNAVKIVCHPDARIKYNDMTAIIECKAVKENTFEDVRKGNISDEWYGQAQAYMIGYKLKRAYFIIKNRVTSNILKPISISLDPEWCKENLKDLQDVMRTFRGTGNFPREYPLIPNRKHKTPNVKECIYCPFREECWKPEDKPAHIPDELEEATGLSNTPEALTLF